MLFGGSSVALTEYLNGLAIRFHYFINIIQTMRPHI